ncbi:MAG TPA: FAD-dependent oxidoreductase [Chloroflexia bacterium]|jgi:NADPH-dependent 2,4-dienoyl-CoA reductase/sulfur reductase-like enzyme
MADITHSKYLIVGGGMAAAAAIRGIRDIDPTGSIGLISEESDPPYKRPPLSKKLWAGKPLKSIWTGVESKGVDMYLGRKAISLDPEKKEVTDDRGTVYSFDKLLLATGSAPRQLAFGEGEIIYFRTVEDYRRLQSIAEKGTDFAVIGGGFVGSELAAALAMNGKLVTMIVPGAGISERIFPSDVVAFLNDYYRDKGVDILLGESAAGVVRNWERLKLSTRSGREIIVDGVVAGIGAQPNVELAAQAGLEVADGIVVDEFLRTNNPDIYSAGDVASFFDHTLDLYRRVEHEDNANTMGRIAGRNMAGEEEAYDHLPYFYSDLFDLGYEAVGELDARLDVVADWTEPYREGVLYYMRDGRVLGVLLWNVWDQVEAARRLIAEQGPFRAEDLKGRLPEVSREPETEQPQPEPGYVTGAATLAEVNS